MTYKYLRGDLRFMLELAIEHRLPSKVNDWKDNLAKDRLTTEMRDVFAALGWISSRQDGRITGSPPDATDPADAAPGDEPGKVSIREPEVDHSDEDVELTPEAKERRRRGERPRI